MLYPVIMRWHVHHFDNAPSLAAVTGMSQEVRHLSCLVNELLLGDMLAVFRCQRLTCAKGDTR